MTTGHDRLWLQIIIGLFLGAALGYALGPDLELVSAPAAKEISAWLALPGNLFLNVIRFVVIPLVISSVTLGVAQSGDVAKVRKIGGAIVVWFLFTSAVAATLAITIGTLLAPGKLGPGVERSVDLTRDIPTAQDLTSDIPGAISGIIPTNPFAAITEGNMLAIIVAAAIFGVALLVLNKKESDPLVHLMASVQSASLTIINFIMKFAPIAVFGLIAKVMIEGGVSVIGDLGAYMGTFLLILASILVFYVIVLVTVSRRNPWEFAKAIREPFVLAFSTSSSSATMPVTLQAAEDNLKIDKTVSRMVIPLGTTVNLDGTSAYQAIVIIFLAQFFGIDLDTSQIVLLVVLSVAASVGAPGVPGGVLAILVGILADFGIPASGFAMILAVDRILDMCRTSVNVTGDLVTTTVMERIAGSRDAH